MSEKAIEKYTGFFKSIGYTAAFGKIFGYLVTASDPKKTFDDIVSDLHLSKGSVSATLKMMESHGYVSSTIPVGSRKRVFFISLNNRHHGIETRIRDSVRFTDLLIETLKNNKSAGKEHLMNLKMLIRIEELTQKAMHSLINEIRKQ